MDFDGLKSAIIEMLSGDHVPVDVTSFQNDTTNFANKDDVITYLIHLGYVQTFKTAFVPNEEIRQELIRAIRRKKWNELIVFQQESEKLLNQTLSMDGTAVARSIEKNTHGLRFIDPVQQRKLVKQCISHCLLKCHAVLLQTNPRITCRKRLC